MKYYHCQIDYITVEGKTPQEVLEKVIILMNNMEFNPVGIEPFNVEIKYNEESCSWSASFPCDYSEGKHCWRTCLW